MSMLDDGDEFHDGDEIQPTEADCSSMSMLDDGDEIQPTAPNFTVKEMSRLMNILVPANLDIPIPALKEENWIHREKDEQTVRSTFEARFALLLPSDSQLLKADPEYVPDGMVTIKSMIAMHDASRCGRLLHTRRGARRSMIQKLLQWRCNLVSVGRKKSFLKSW
jgi:hypothetical protein